jgi:RND superfamily putative drug exporter
VVDLADTSLTMGALIGLGVGIDYALFIVNRHRKALMAGASVEYATVTALGTSGRAVVFAGLTVVVALLGMAVVGLGILTGMGQAAAVTVLFTVLAAVTLLPALLGVLGHRVNKGSLPQRFQPAEDRTGASVESGGWARWARTVLRHPWLALPAAGLLLLLSVPVLGLKLGIDLGLAALADQPSGKAEIILADTFSEGAMSPVQVLVSHQGDGRLTTADLRSVDRLATQARKDGRVTDAFAVTDLMRAAGVPLTAQGLATLERSDDPAVKNQLGPMVNLGSGGDRTVVTVVPSVAIDSTAAGDLVTHLRDEIVPPLSAGPGPQMLVGGASAQFVDLSAETLGKLPVVIGLVLTLSFLYLMVVFRSLLIPLKAVLMNLLATGAAFGITAWVFEEGHLQGLLDFHSVGFVQVYLPIMVFALLFGLSMDYEVFLIRRMQEEWVTTHDNERSVAVGLAHTARPIAAAAMIMAAVFGCFIVADVLELKEFGLALAVAVVLDATLVRLLLVPAFMKVAGPANWWLPAWLGRLLPDLRLE